MSVKKVLIGIAGLLLGLSLTQVYADTPNFYSCKGKDVSLTFDTTNLANSTLVNLNLGKKNYTAGEANIETQTTVMGDVKTLLIKIVADVEVKKASFIIPTINLGTDSSGELISEAKFKSQLVITTIATPFISTPYIGVVNKSDYIDLICKASLVFKPL